MTPATPPTLSAPARQAELASSLFGPIRNQPRPAAEVRSRTIKRARTRRSPVRLLVEVVATAALALGLALALNAFVMQTFLIPSGSMASTLHVSDRVIVTRLAPSLFDVHRGDIVVFTDTTGWLKGDGMQAPIASGAPLVALLGKIGLAPVNGEYLIKRVIGVGGDTVTADGTGPVSVNGAVLNETYLDAGVAGSTTAFTVTVPAGCLWVMGDNREHSADSRFHVDDRNGGCVPLENVFGVAQLKVFPFSDAGVLRNPGAVFADIPAAVPGAAK